MIIKDPRKIASFLLVASIVVISGIIRVWDLNNIPPGLYPDIAINGNDALDTIETRKLKLFYPENNGREGLFMWLISLSFLIFGPSVWAIRIVSAIIGTTTILGTYLLAKELFKDYPDKQIIISPNIPQSAKPSWTDWALTIITPVNAIALLSAVFLAFSFWHINFSRMGFRVIMVPFILTYFGYFFLRGFNNHRRLWLIISGFFFGMGFYTYIGFRMAVLMLPFILIPYFIRSVKEKTIKDFIVSAMCFLGVIFITALPIGIYFITHFGDFIGRTSGVSIFNQSSPIKAFFTSLFSHLLMFNIRGDFNWRHNFSGLAMLPISLGILFITGIIVSVINFIKSIKAKHYSLITAHAFLFSGFFSSLLPGILTIEGIPHDLRVLGVVSFIYLWSALGTVYLFIYIYQYTSKKSLVIIAGLLLLFSVCYSQTDLYFKKWGKNPEVTNAFSNNFVELGNYLNSIEEGVSIYVIVNQGGVAVPYPNGIPVTAQTPIFIERVKFNKPRATYLKPSQLDQIKISGKTIIIPIGNLDSELTVNLLRNFPEGHFWKAGQLMMFRINFDIAPAIQ